MSSGADRLSDGRREHHHPHLVRCGYSMDQSQRRLKVWSGPSDQSHEGQSWPERPVGDSPGKPPLRTSGCPGRSPARGRDLTLRKRILCDPSIRWETIAGTAGIATASEPWNTGKFVGQKAPFKPMDIWALRVRLQMESRVRELALFIDLRIDRELRGCDHAALKPSLGGRHGSRPP